MPTNSARLASIIKKNKNMPVNASDVIVSVPNMITVLPKLQVDNQRKTPISDIEKIKMNRVELEKIHKRMKSVNENNENIIKLFPDIELSIQILVSTIISSKNMSGTFLNYRLDSPIASTSATSLILEKIKEHMTKRYKIEEKLPEWIREAMFEKGAYVMAVIPESAVDEIINADLSGNSISTENFKSAVNSMSVPLGFIGKDVGLVGLESYSDKVKESMKSILDCQSFSLSDNYDALKFPQLKDKFRNSLIKAKLRRKMMDVSMEGLEYGDIFRKTNAMGQDNSTVLVKQKSETKRTSLGAPMVIKLNSQAVIPIFTPGDPSKHICYVVLQDAATGYPLNDFMQEDQMLMNNGYTGQSGGNDKALTQQAVNNLISQSSDVGIDAVYQIYKDVIEKQILDKVKRGVYGHEVEMSNKNDIYFTMFARALANQKTSMLVIPADLVTYMTYDYNKNGTGRSILENLSVLMSMRSIMLVSKIVSFAKQAIDVTNVNISFDPNDPDPEKTIEEVMDSVFKMRKNFFPLGVNNPSELVDWSQRAGLKFSYENHPGMPNMKIDFEPSQITHEIPSDDIEKVIRDQCIMSMGLSPETVDSAAGADFATTVRFSNELMIQRTVVKQAKTEVFINKFTHDIIVNDEELREVIRKTIDEHLADIEKHLTSGEKELLSTNKQDFYDHLIDKIADNVRVGLPRPESTNIETLTAEFDKFKENIDKVLDSIISTEILSQDTCGDMSEHVDTVKNVYKHHLIRKWMSENNFYPEVFDLVKQTNEGEDKLDLNKVMTDHIKSVMLASGDLFSSIKTSRDAMNVDVLTVGIGELQGGESSSSSDSSSSGDEGDTGDKGGDDFGLGDDLGDLGDDPTGDDEKTPEEETGDDDIVQGA